MAWQDVAKTMDMLASLSNALGGEWTTKGASRGPKGNCKSNKGKGKDKESDADDQGFQCMWECCSAARREQPTRWGKAHCHCCGRAKGVARAPPLEQLTEKA